LQTTMKTSQILIALALFACVANALDVASLFGPTAGRISASDLAEISNSEGKKSALNKYLFKEGDTNGDGYLSLAEVKVLYNRLTQVTALKSAPDATISSRFNMADHKNKDNRLSYSEFIWLMGSDLAFANSNYATALGPVTTLNNVVTNLNNIWNNPVFKSLYSLFTGTLDKKSVSYEKFKSIINYLPIPCKIKIQWTECVLRGYYKHCDANGNGIVTLDEINAVVQLLLNDLYAILACYKK